MTVSPGIHNLRNSRRALSGRISGVPGLKGYTFSFTPDGRLLIKVPPGGLENGIAPLVTRVPERHPSPDKIVVALGCRGLASELN